jgi:hypothetical protein
MPCRGFTVAAACEAIVIGQLLIDGVARPLAAELHARLYQDGSWSISLFDPEDPLSGEFLSGETGSAALARAMGALAQVGTRADCS